MKTVTLLYCCILAFSLNTQSKITSAKSFPLNPKDLVLGGLLQCVEASTLGMPLEVWKTYMGTHRNETPVEAFCNIYKNGGPAAFWKGLTPKLIEAFLKGSILLFSKETIIKSCRGMGASETVSGVLGGFGGGIAQVIVMAPCTFLVTAAVTGDKSVSLTQRISQTYASNGIAGFYRGGTALIFRQGTNWASRQGFTDGIRGVLKRRLYGSKSTQLSVKHEAIAGIIGGALSVWNQPFEVMRIEAQSAATKGNAPRGFLETGSLIIKENGIAGLFKGMVPRIGTCVW